MLEQFKRAKQDEIALLLQLRASGHSFVPWTGPRPSFGQALTRPGSSGIIAEYKRASPSKGEINTTLLPLAACSGYKAAGACALSVLTEKLYFKGDLDHLLAVAPVGLPLLRKDFIFHPVQVEATRTTPASAILLIVRLFRQDSDLKNIHSLCLEHDLEPVVEIFDDHDLARAKALNCRIIQVNNRDLNKLDTNIHRCLRLVQHKEHGEIWIGASGISTPEDVKRLKAAGLDALLIGTALMQSSHPGQQLSALIGGAP